MKTRTILSALAALAATLFACPANAALITPIAQGRVVAIAVSAHMDYGSTHYDELYAPNFGPFNVFLPGSVGETSEDGLRYAGAEAIASQDSTIWAESISANGYARANSGADDGGQAIAEAGSGFDVTFLVDSRARFILDGSVTASLGSSGGSAISFSEVGKAVLFATTGNNESFSAAFELSPGAYRLIGFANARVDAPDSPIGDAQGTFALTLSQAVPDSGVGIGAAALAFGLALARRKSGL